MLIAGAGWGFSNYDENVKVTHSGTASAPITFKAAQTSFRIYGSDTGFAIQGSYVHVVGADLESFTSPAALTVSGSNDVVDESSLSPGTAADALFTGTAKDDTIERSRIYGWNAANGVQIENGASGITVSTNVLRSESGIPVTATGTVGLNITSNTFVYTCGTSISLTGVSQASVENNVVASECFNPGPPALVVDSASSGSTTVGYNVLSTANGTLAPYSWAGTTYTTAASFGTATGQGAGDLVVAAFDPTTNSISADNPAIDSAKSDAPGELTTDVDGNPRADSTSVADTGAGTYTYYDRGAVEYQEFTGATLTAYADSAQRVTASLDLQGVAWGSSAIYTINWGDGTSYTQGASDTSQLVTVGLPGNHMYTSRGTYTITATLTDESQTITKTTTFTTTGSTYAAVTPTRVLDTRTGIGAAKGKVAPNSTVALDVTSGVAGAPAASTITAVVLNVTVTNPTAAGYITAYPYGGTPPAVSNLNFGSGETVPNLVTVKVDNGKVGLYNSSAGTSDLVADVQGYYVNAGGASQYKPLTPTRLLDTRSGTGAAKAAVAPGGTVSLKVEGAGSIPASGVSALAVNVTVTGPTSSGYISVYPDGGSRPNTSNVNFGPGETVPNMTIVKVGADGKVDFYNGSAGTVQLIADAAGYYAASGDAFVPLDPTRVLDTRSAIGQESAAGIPVSADSNAVWFFNGPLPPEAALVLNVTVTNPKAGGYITAYPDGGTRPNASNLNFSPAETVPNLVMVGVGAQDTVDLYNGSAGTTDLVADLFGYFS